MKNKLICDATHLNGKSASQIEFIYNGTKLDGVISTSEVEEVNNPHMGKYKISITIITDIGIKTVGSDTVIDL